MKELLRWLLPRLPLPMLALAASYGVYQFALLFVPAWVARAQASAFELVYISLAIVETPSLKQRNKARAISMGAVAVSVLYNSLAGYFHRNGLGTLPLWGEMVLAVLHGAPLAIVAYLVADLLLHKSLQEQTDNAIESPIATPALPNLLPSLQENATDSIPARDEVAPEQPVAPSSSTQEHSSTKAAVEAYLDEHPSAKIAELLDAFPGKARGTLSGYLSGYKARQEEMVTSANGRPS